MASAKACLAFVALDIFVKCFYCADIKPPNQYHQLITHLFLNQNYSKNVRPVLDISTTTQVGIRLALLNIVSFDERAETLIITGKLYIEWKDEYLSWNSSEYGGLDTINIPQNEVWKPDIVLENSIESYHDLGAKSLNVRIKSDGSVLWKPMEVFRSTCPANVANFPMDTQLCTLYFEAWTHSLGNIRVYNGSSDVQLHGYDGHPEWAISDSKAMSVQIRDDMYVVFYLTLKRKWLYVMLNVILPIALLSILSGAVFLLPADCGEKASFSITVFLSLSVFLTIVSEQLPRTSDNVSVFNIYVFVQVILSTIITIMTTIQLRLHCKQVQRPVPAFLARMVISCWYSKNRRKKLDTLTNGDVKATTQSVSDVAKFTDEEELDVTWKMVGDMLDPVCFVIYLFVNIGFTLSLLLFSVAKA